MDTRVPDQASKMGGEIPTALPARMPRKARPHWLRRISVVVLWVVLFAVALWAFGALWFDFPEPGWGRHVAMAFAVALLAALVLTHGTKRKLATLAAANLGVLAWWFTLEPFNERSWQADVAQTAWAEISGDIVTLHNVRNCEYRSETDYTPRWETRVVDLSKLTGIDIAITYWGSPYMAHPIFSFQFEDALPVCFSIETRKELGEAYSAVGGLYRQYELIYICADERDVLRLRSNYRKGEDVYLYRTTAPVAAARQRFLEYVTTLNALHFANKPLDQSSRFVPVGRFTSTRILLVVNPKVIDVMTLRELTEYLRRNPGTTLTSSGSESTTARVMR